MDDEFYFSESLNLFRELLKERSFTIAEIWLHLSKNCKQFIGQNTETLRSFLLKRTDVFELNDDYVSLKNVREHSHNPSDRKIENKTYTMNNTVANGGKKLDLPIAKLNIPKKEIEVLHALVQLVSDKAKMTLPMLAANMSSLSPEHRAVIGQGQKAIQKFIKKYPDVFTITGEFVSISPKLHLHSSISENYLQQVICLVTKIGSGFGFLSAPDDSIVYFGANNFEGGNCQDLNKHLKIGDLVIVDAEKGDPNYTADWRAIRVSRMKRQPSESLGSHSGSCTSLDRISLSSSVKFSNDDSSAECEKSRRLSSSSSGVASNQQAGSKQEVIAFLENRIKSRGGKISLQNLTGHLSSLPNNLRDHIGYKLEDLRTFIKNNSKYFVLENEFVHLVSNNHVDESDTISNSSSVTSTSQMKTNDVDHELEGLSGDIHFLDANGGGLIRLTNGKLVPFEAKAVSDSIEELKKGLVVFCEAENTGNKLHIVKIWQPPTNAYGSKQIPISGYTGIVVRVFPDYGFINYGLSTEDNIYFQKTYVDGVSEKDNLTDILSIGSKVICDAIHAGNFSSKYRAIRVIPLNNEEGFKTVTSRHNKKSSLLESTSPFSLSDEKEVYVSDEEWDYVESADNKLHMCSGRIVSLYPTYGFIQRGNRGKDPENVYFNNLVFVTESGKPIDNLMDILKIGDIVNYDAERGRTESSKWRATAVWKSFNHNHAIQSNLNEEMLIDRTGTIVKIFPSKGIISFGPHPYFERVFFSIEFYYRYSNKVSSLTQVLNIGDIVNFTAVIDEAGMKTKWKAILVWTGEKPIFPLPPTHKFPEFNPVGINSTEEILRNVDGYVTTVFPTKGLLAFGSTMYSNEVFFTLDNFYDNCKTVKNLQSHLKDKDFVTFDAVVDKPGLRTKWRAVLVWTGRRPNVVTEIDKKIQLKNFLSQTTCHLYNPHFDSAPLVTLEPTKKPDICKRGLPMPASVISPNVSEALTVKPPFESLKHLEENSLISDEFPSLDMAAKKDINHKDKLNAAGTLSFSHIISRMPEINNETKNSKIFTNYNSIPFHDSFEEKRPDDNKIGSINNSSNAVHEADSFASNIDFLKQGETVLQNLHLNDTIDDLSEKDDQSVVTIESGKTGIIEKLVSNGGYIKTTRSGKKSKSIIDENIHVWFTMDSVYVNEVKGKPSDISVGDTVHFNVKRNPFGNEVNAWVATLVWKGRKPRNSTLSEGSRTSNRSSELNEGAFPISDESFSFSSTDIDDNVPLNSLISKPQKPLEHKVVQKLYKSPASQRSRSLSPSVNPALMQHFTRKNSVDNKPSMSSAEKTIDVKNDSAGDGIFSRKTCSLEDLPKYDPFSTPNLEKPLIRSRGVAGIGLKEPNLDEKKLIPWDDGIPKEKWPTLDEDDLSTPIQPIARAEICRPLADTSNHRSRILTDSEHTIVNKNPFSHWQMGNNSFLFDSSSDDKQPLYPELRSLWGSGDPISKNNPEGLLGKDIFKKLSNVPENLSTFSMDISMLYPPESSSNETSLSDITEKCINLMKYVQEMLKKREQEVIEAPIKDFHSIQDSTEVTKVDSSTQTISTGDISSHHIYSGD